MEIYLAVVFGLLGACIGSFLNVCIDRLPDNKSLLRPGSRCDACGRRLTPLDLVPVFSYLALRGRCRSCGAKIPFRVFLVELGSALFLGLLFWYQGLTADFAIIAFYTYIFLVIGIIDLQTRLILNKIVYPAVIISLPLVAFFTDRGLVNSLIGAGVGMLCILVPYLVTLGRGMGFGDVKMAVLIGLATGFGQVLVAIIGGIILGGLTAAVLLVFRLKKRKEAIPFGPFLSIGAVVTLLWGRTILDWYLGLFTH